MPIRWRIPVENRPALRLAASASPTRSSASVTAASRRDSAIPRASPSTRRLSAADRYG